MLDAIRTVLALVEHPLGRGELEAILGVQLRRDGGNDSFDFYSGVGDGRSWVGRVDFRERVGGGKKLLVLYVSSDVAVAVDLEALVDAHGAQPELDVNPHSRPSGSYAYRFGSPDKRIVYSFDQATKCLRSVSIAWG